MNDDNTGSCLIGLLFTGVISFFCYKSGYSKATRECEDRSRDIEILKLKQEIACLKASNLIEKK